MKKIDTEDLSGRGREILSGHDAITRPIGNFLAAVTVILGMAYNTLRQEVPFSTSRSITHRQNENTPPPVSPSLERKNPTDLLPPSPEYSPIPRSFATQESTDPERKTDQFATVTEGDLGNTTPPIQESAK